MKTLSIFTFAIAMSPLCLTAANVSTKTPTDSIVVAKGEREEYGMASSFVVINSSDEEKEIMLNTLYAKLELENLHLSKDAFKYALQGYEYLLQQNALQNTGVITICDYTQSSRNKRLYVIDLVNVSVLFNTYVSHGKGSGYDTAKSFSNNPRSHKSTLGFMITGNIYKSKKVGTGLRLIGTEDDINDNVEERGIVMHGSDYVGYKYIQKHGMMGRSWGCPAIAKSEMRPILNTIKGGSCVFMYYPDNQYLQSSKILNTPTSWIFSLGTCAELDLAIAH